MPDAQLTRIIQHAADTIIADFQREHLPPHIALAIVGCVAGRLRAHVPHVSRTEFIACLQNDNCKQH